MPNISIIIPAYNEEKTIGKVLSQIRETMEKEKREYEIIVVDDSSADNTAKCAREMGAKVIKHPYNKGYGASLKNGVRAAKNEIIVTMDSDGQHDPKDIKRLLQYIKEYDMVVGARKGKINQQWIKWPGRIVLRWLVNYLANAKIPDVNSGFRAIKKQYVEEFMHILPNGFSFSTTITLAMFKAAYNVKYTPISVAKRKGGKSTVSLTKDGLQTILLIVRCISLFNPLKVYVPVALILLLFGFLLSLLGIIKFHSFPRTGVLIILSGIIIFFFGISADQIAALRRERHQK